MTDTTAAATLTLEISTAQASANLKALGEQYDGLRTKLGQPIGSNDLLEKFAAQEAKIKSLSTEILALKRTYATLTESAAKHEQVATKGLSSVSRAARETAQSVGALATSAVKYNSLMGSSSISATDAWARANTLLANSNTKVAASMTAVTQSAVKYDSLMGVAAPKVAEAAKSNDLLTASYTRVAVASQAAGTSAVKYDSLMGVAAPKVAEVAKSNDLLTASYTRVAAASQAAGTSAVKYDSLMGVAAPKIAEVAKSNDLLTASYTRVAAASTVARDSVVRYSALLGVASAETTKLAQANTLLMNSYTRVARPTAPAQASRSSVTYSPLLGVTPTVQDSGLSTLARDHQALTSAVTASAAGQINWNNVAKEGHTVVRGLAGSLGSLWVTYGQLAPLLAGAALGGAFVHAAKAGSEFAYQLTFVKTLSEETSAAVDLLSKSALELGRTSLQGPSEIASGYRVLAQAGLNVTDSIAAMPEVLHLATVGEMDMEAAAITLVGVLNAFGLSVSNVTHVGDVFAKAAAVSQTSVQEMTEAMKTASVVGEQYGASMEDTATALTLLAKVNIRGTAAGTAFRNMLKELYAPVPGSEKIFKKLGIDAQDAVGNLRPFADVIYDLKEKLTSFNKGDQVKILQKLFGERGAKEAIAMLALTREKWEELRDSISNSSGFMDGVAKELEDTAKGRWLKAINTMKATFITAFTEMEPAFKDLADSLNGLFTDKEFVDGLKQAVSAMLTLTKVAIELAPVLIKVAEAWLILKAATISVAVWNATTVAVTGFAGALAAASGAMGPVIAGTTVAGTAVRMLPAAFAALLTPMGLAVGGLAAVGTAFLLFRDRTAESMEKSTEKVRNFGTEAKKILDDLAVNLSHSSTAINQARISAAQTAVAAQNSTVDDLAKTYIGKYAKNANLLGTGAAVADAQAYLDRVASSDGAAKDRFRTEGSKQRAAQALVDAQNEARARQRQFYPLQAQVEHKRVGEANEAAVAAAAANAKPKTGNASDILAEDPRGGGAARAEKKDNSKILADNLSSSLKREQIKLGSEVVDIETQLAAQTISSAVATERKNAASIAELETERSVIKSFLEQAKAAGDRVQTAKIQNDLDENSLKLLRERERAQLDLTKVMTADRNAIENTGLASRRYAEDLEFEIQMLGKTTAEVARLRIEREASRSTENLAVLIDRKQVNPGVAAALQEEIEARKAAQQADAAYQESWVGGWAKARDAWVKDATSAARQAQSAFEIMSSSMERALDEFLTTGKINFADFAKSIILEMAKIRAEALLAEVSESIGGGGIGGFIGKLLGGLFGGGGSANTSTTAVLSAGGVANSTPFAKGGVFSGAPSLHAYANTVRSTPTTFAYQNLHGFAKGGVFAEAGTEAVMPIMQSELGRDAQGRLGIKRQATGDTINTINLKVYVNGNQSAPDVRRSAAQGAREGLTAYRGAQRFA